MALPKPLRKIEVYLHAWVTGETDNLPEPRTKIETYLKQLAENPPSGAKGEEGTPGKDGTNGKDGKGVKSIALTVTDGAVTAGTVTYTDNSTGAITITTK